MVKNIIITVVLTISTHLYSQNDKPSYTSPVILNDNSVQFNLYAPNAKNVSATGTFSKDTLFLKKMDTGLWTVNSEVLEPEIYHYQLNVDGLIIADPKNQNPYPWLDAKSELIIPGSPSLIHELTNVPHGILHDHIYKSSATNTMNSVSVYTPPNYDSETLYPVLFLLHGFGEKVSFWSDFGKINLIADNLISQGKMAPMLIVMPNGDPVEGDYHTFFTSQTEGPKWMEKNNSVLENDFINDLIPYLKKNYSIHTNKVKWAIAGSSMGGAQAAKVGFNNLDKYGSIICLSTWLEIPLLDISEKESINNLDLLVFKTGKEDSWGFTQNEKMHDWLKTNGIKHEYLVSNGGHDWDVWRKDMAEVLTILFN
ncbi:alpha/beta hydrolase-fold protein [Urechidicola vernalis]|uniref:Alpha/beta hydrolase-fold protein n=1 Tax=Urechidicola vernalis TaxID=3075600 RepID=A0ABU2Y2N2_9FLAO|nr:alpha/beta hydrolase-fold protein [Urechidicola sp. P050]MDT0552045.1 alpha/beta hydrolase-fold protein [Urechidicola sp. P050]